MRIPTYLQRSPKTGVYSFRLAVPTNLRTVIGKREIKRTLKTKVESEAVIRGRLIYEETLKRFAVARSASVVRGETEVSPRALYDEALQWAETEGFNPFGRSDPYVDEEMAAARDCVADALIEKINLGKATALDCVKLDSVMGNLKPPKPKVSDMVALYLSETNPIGKRGEAEQKQFDQMIRRYEAYLRKSLRRDKAVHEINRADARDFRDWLKSEQPGRRSLKPGSVNKALRMISAIFNHAIQEWELEVANPFLGLLEPEGAREKRRSFTAEELQQYLDAAGSMNGEAEHCTILMAFTGARTKEIIGLERQDINLSASIPYIYVRPNITRPKLKTPMSKRRLPLVGSAFDAARSALSETHSEEPSAPLFPRYARPRGNDALSAVQNKLIRDRLGIADPKLVGYSTRHTLKDRLRNALVPPEVQDAILGHSKGQVSEGYGEGYWLPVLQDALLKATSRPVARPCCLNA